MIWAVCAGAAVFFALSFFAVFVAGLFDLRGMGEAEPMGAVGAPGGDGSASLILLEHHGTLYACRDVWDCIQVSRTLAEIDRLPEAAA